ncbi:hypothetical protein A2810_01685 [candidate division Kazan bacterium RIFCSPHIGHO2_01_FULL_49_10]|uniref:Uncharacterized protein n=1 Tax=candidate division Kazan bacterium RIFCSPLOWO2_01_FULL_48_13 TaxID=1798539 RepID=A0A1F4PNT1_UNCK3|nr:MAG: hypothetical protein A2810_01685 [candidate division Kazan bacterium RIFCSPHIGHO2_01_FULL_49_10]OGB85256.1 MAG: hypothetical protein A2994_01390 [candidate division Kazan bacterium RIFCSPLOWO2_01_FULL_48_13]
MPDLFHSFINFVKSELRLAVGLGVLLVVLVGLGLAADSSVQFDFGDGLGLEDGYLPVNGGASMYPVDASGLQYGWLSDTLVFSNGEAVGSKLNRDGNKGFDPARFRVTGLNNGNYRLILVSGSLDTAFSTKITISGRSFSTATLINQWNTLTFDATVADGSLELLFQRVGTNLWAVDSLVIAPSAAPAVQPTFDMTVQPSLHTVRVGGMAIYRVSINPLSGYASPVNLSISGLVGNISAQFAPASAMLPLVADLTITTTAATPLTQYDFVVIATGQDAGAYMINKSISLIVTNSAAVPIVVKPDSGTTSTPTGDGGQTGSDSSPIDDTYLTPRTAEDVRAEQKSVDEYAAVEAKKLADPQEILELKDISTINGFEMFPGAVAKTPFEESLQYLTRTGIIDIAVDSAPPASIAEPEPLGFWARFFRTMVSPTL